MNPERICYGCFREKEPGTICPHCGFDEKEEQPYLALPLGTVLGGRYVTGKVLGIGGFGITYLGYDLTLDIRVAVKEYMPSALATRNADRYQVTLTGKSDADYRYGMKRFLDEAKILARLQDTPNIVSVQNYFQENGTAYFVMEYVDGMNLKTFLSGQGGRISWHRALEILLPVMKALAQVHAQGILHRDISPENIFITARGESRLLDFGAARFALGDGKSVSVILKHGYAPEEQYSSHGNQGPWTDVYAMGATLYRCVTGMLPPDAVERIHQDTLKTPSRLGISLPGKAEKALLKALAVRTEDRFRSMNEFISALTGEVPSEFAGGFRTAAYPDGMVSAGKGTGTVMPQPAAASGKRKKFLPFCLAGGGAAAVILCLLLTGVFSGGTKGEENLSASVSGESAETPEEPETAEGQGETEMVSWDLGGLNATISAPENYSWSDSGWMLSDGGGTLLLMDYRKDFGIPVYSLSDVAENTEMVAAWSADWMQHTDYELLNAGFCTIGGREAYLICTEGRSSVSEKEKMVAAAVEGDNGFGCYLICAAYSETDPEKETEILDIIDSFQVRGPVDVPYDVYSDEGAGIKFILDSTLAEQVKTNGSELIVYPAGTAAQSEAYLEVGQGKFLGTETPEEVLEVFTSIFRENGAETGEAYLVQAGGAEWMCRNFLLDGLTCSVAAASVGGQCVFMDCQYDPASGDAVLELGDQILTSVRPL